MGCKLGRREIVVTFGLPVTVFFCRGTIKGEINLTTGVDIELRFEILRESLTAAIVRRRLGIVVNQRLQINFYEIIIRISARCF